MSTFRIVQLIDTLDPGGAERMAVNLANEFSSRNHPNLLIVTRHAGLLKSYVDNQKNVIELGKRNTLDFKVFQNLLRTLDKFHVDVLHAHGPSIYWAILVKWWKPSIQLIWHDHLGISVNVVENNPRKEISWIAKWIDFVITANESTQDYWRFERNIPSDKVRYLRNFPQLIPIEKQINSIFTFLHLANYRPEKGHLFVVRAASILKESGFKFRVRMVGKDVNTDWKSLVQEEVKKLQLQEFVFLQEEDQNVPHLLSESDVGLVASEREGLPVALLEYGLAGLPVISTNVGQCSEVLSSGKFGELIPPGDIEAMAEAMKRVFLDSEYYRVQGSCFQSHVKENYGSQHFFLQYEDILHQLNLNTTELD